MPFIKPTLKPSTATENRDESGTCADPLLQAGTDVTSVEEEVNAAKLSEKDESSDSSDSDSDDDDDGAAATKAAAPKIVTAELCAPGGTDRVDAAAAAADSDDDDDDNKKEGQESIEDGDGGADERENAETETTPAREGVQMTEATEKSDESDGGESTSEHDTNETAATHPPLMDRGGEGAAPALAATPAPTQQNAETADISAAPPVPPGKTSGQGAAKGTAEKRSKSREGSAPSKASKGGKSSTADEPKPPKTALACFRSTLKGDALKGAAKTWSEMSDASKLSFERSAEIDKLRHRKEVIAHLSAGHEFNNVTAKRNAERFAQEDRDAAAGVQKPKAPVSAYMRFSIGRSKEIRAEAPSLKITEISKLVGEEWKALDASAKAPFEAAYKEEKREYDEKHQDYRKAIAAFEESSGAAKRSKKSASTKSGSTKSATKDDGSDALSGGRKRPIRITYEDLAMQPSPAPARSAFEFHKEETRARLRAENELTRSEIEVAVQREWEELTTADTARFIAMERADEDRSAQEQERWQDTADLQLAAARKAACVRPLLKREPETKRLKIDKTIGDELAKHGWSSLKENFSKTWFSPTMHAYKSVTRIVEDHEEQWREDEARFAGILACITRA